MDGQGWQARIERAREEHAATQQKFLARATEEGVEAATEWMLEAVTDARVRYAWWVRLGKAIGQVDAAHHIEAVEEMIETAHDEILTATTYTSTNPVANAIRAFERDALARWHREASKVLRLSRRDAVGTPARTEGDA